MNFIPQDFMGGFLNFFKNPFQRYTETVFINSTYRFFGAKEPKFITITDNEYELYSTTAELFYVINKKADLFSNGLFYHKRKTKKGIEEVSNSPYIKLLNNPHKLHTRNEFLQYEMVNKSLYGASFINPLKGYDSQAVPSALIVLPSAWMKVYPTGKFYNQINIEDMIKKFTMFENTPYTKVDFKPNELIYQKDSRPKDPIMPMSPLEPIMMELSNIRAVKGFENVVFNEHGQLGILSGGGKDVDGGTTKMSNKDRERIENQYNRDYGWKQNKRKVLIAESPVNWQATTFPIKDYNIFETIDQNFLSIINNYKLNANLFVKDAKFSNLMEGKRMAYQDAIIPYATNFCFNLSQYFGLLEKDEYIDLDYSHIEALQKDNKSIAETNKLKADAYKTLQETGDFSSDELKLMLGLES